MHKQLINTIFVVGCVTFVAAAAAAAVGDNAGNGSRARAHYTAPILSNEVNRPRVHSAHVIGVCGRQRAAASRPALKCARLRDSSKVQATSDLRCFEQFASRDCQFPLILIIITKQSHGFIAIRRKCLQLLGQSSMLYCVSPKIYFRPLSSHSFTRRAQRLRLHAHFGHAATSICTECTRLYQSAVIVVGPLRTYN